MGKYFNTTDVKGFLIVTVATGDQAEMIRKVLDKFKGSSFDYVIQNTNIHRQGFL
jgi:hypothetical protein